METSFQTWHFPPPKNSLIRVVWSSLAHVALFCILKNLQTKSDHICGYIVPTILAVKSSLHSVSLQLLLALSARDNLESLFSYVEEEEERNRGKSVSFSFTPPFSFPLLSLPVLLFLWVHRFIQRGWRLEEERRGHFRESWKVDLVQKIFRIRPSWVFCSDCRATG